MTRKTNTALIALLGTILMGLATWTLVTLIELQLTVTMIQSDLMSIDKQFGRVYNFIDSVRGKYDNLYVKLKELIESVITNEDHRLIEPEKRDLNKKFMALAWCLR